MKKFVSLLEAIAFFFMAFPMTALAADGAVESISLVYCIPFAGLLLCVASEAAMYFASHVDPATTLCT